MALTLALEPVLTVASGIRYGQPVVGPSWLMLVSAFVPFSILSVAMLTWGQATQTHIRRTLTAIAIGVVGVVGLVVVVAILERLVGQLAPGWLPSPYETTIWQAYGFEWLVSLGYLATFGWLVSKLAGRISAT